MRLPRLTTRRRMVLVAVVAFAIVAIPMIDLIATDARERADDARWAEDPSGENYRRWWEDFDRELEEKQKGVGSSFQLGR